MAYTRVTWVNAPTATTPVGATNLNHVEQGIVDAHYPPVVSALPGSPSDGQIVWFSPASFQVGTPFHPAILCRYRSSTFDTYHWECAGGAIDGTQNLNPLSVASSTYVVPTGGAGPTNIVVPAIGEYDVEIGVNLSNGSSSTPVTLFLSYDVGATPAVDADALLVPVTGLTIPNGSYFRRYRKTFTVAGATLVPKARVNNTANGPTFQYFFMRIIPLFIN